MKSLLLILLLATPLSTELPPKARNLEAINTQVWLPFVEGVMTDKAELYVGVHSKDFYWVAAGSEGRMMDFAEYDEDSRMVMKRRKEAGERGEMEIRFLERNITDAFASEKAITRFVMYREGKPPAASYGIAQYFSRKENGVWKIVLRYHSPEKATEEMFLGAAPIADVARFTAAKPR